MINYSKISIYDSELTSPEKDLKWTEHLTDKIFKSVTFSCGTVSNEKI